MVSHPPMRSMDLFPSLQITSEDHRSIETAAQRLVQTHMEEYEELRRTKKELPNGRWHFVRRDDDIRAYVQKRDGDSHANNWVFAAPTRVRTRRTPGESASPSNDIADFRFIGKLHGSLDDVMYGVINPTLDSMRVKTAYLKDDTVDAAILSTIHKPSITDPFRSLVIKYRENTHLPVIRLVAKSHYYVYMEYNGIAFLPSGERIGFHLLHSLSFPGLHKLKHATPGNLALCGVFRETEPGVVEIYNRAAFYCGGELQRPFVIQEAAKVVSINLNGHIHCGFMKKLAWYIRQSAGKEGRRLSAACKTCGRLVDSMLKKGSRCQICRKALCKKCSIHQELYSFGSDQNVHCQRVFVCALCIEKVEHASTLTLAREELDYEDGLDDMHRPSHQARAKSTRTSTDKFKYLLSTNSA